VHSLAFLAAKFQPRGRKISQNIRLNGHLLGWKPCKLLNAIALGQIKAMNKKTAFTAGLK
jgi:hypothetical protein